MKFLTNIFWFLYIDVWHHKVRSIWNLIYLCSSGVGEFDHDWFYVYDCDGDGLFINTWEYTECRVCGFVDLDPEPFEP